MNQERQGWVPPVCVSTISLGDSEAHWNFENQWHRKIKSTVNFEHIIKSINSCFLKIKQCTKVWGVKIFSILALDLLGYSNPN